MFDVGSTCLTSQFHRSRCSCSSDGNDRIRADELCGCTRQRGVGAGVGPEDISKAQGGIQQYSHCGSVVNNHGCSWKTQVFTTKDLSLGIVLDCLIDVILNANTLSRLQMEDIFYKVDEATPSVSASILLRVSNTGCCETNEGHGRGQKGSEEGHWGTLNECVLDALLEGVYVFDVQVQDVLRVV